MGKMTVTWGPMNLKLPQVPMRERILSLQEEMIKLPQLELETVTMFHGGMMRREVKCPAGSTIVGKIHKHDHFFVLLQGTMQLTTNDEVIEVVGPVVINSTCDTKRAAHAVTDCVCVTFHRCDAVKEEDAEIELIQPESIQLFDARNKLLG